MKKDKAVEVIYNALVSYIEDCAGHGTPEAEEIQNAWDLIRNKVSEVKEYEEQVTGEMILNWHGSDHNIEELADTMADILNGEYDVDVARCEILDYDDDEEGDED